MVQRLRTAVPTVERMRAGSSPKLMSRRVAAELDWVSPSWVSQSYARAGTVIQRTWGNALLVSFDTRGLRNGDPKSSLRQDDRLHVKNVFFCGTRSNLSLTIAHQNSERSSTL